MKFNARHLLILFLILALSFAFGFGFDAVADGMERRRHPQPSEYADAIARSAKEFSIPEPILWATVKCKSNFSSNAVGENGEVGLCGLTVEEFRHVYTEYLGKEPPDAGIRYDPATSIYCGAAYLSELYERYGVWHTVYVALFAGTDAVDAWLHTPENVDSHGRLQNLPREAEAFAATLEETVDTYRRLYD